MSRELFWLLATVVMTGLFWVPYVLNRFAKKGIWLTLDNPRRNEPPHSPWANRMMVAHTNAIENLMIFAPLVLIANEIGVSNNITAWACIAYFWARLVHVVVFTLGIPVVRTLAFLVGFFAQGAIAFEIFRRALLFEPFALILPPPS